MALIIHQTHGCDEAALPRLLRGLRQTVIRCNPQATHLYWSDDALLALLTDDFPRLLPAFQSARVGVQRSDLARLALLHRFGGLYVDTDVEGLRPFAAPLVGGPRLTVAPEPHAQVAALYGPGVYLCNAVMYAPVGDPGVAAALAEVEARWAALGPAMWSEFDAIGGKLLTWLLAQRPELVDVVLPALCYPLNDLKLTGLPTHSADVAAASSGRFGRATQAVHWWVHTNFEGRAALLLERHDRAWPFLQELYGLGK